MKKALAVLLVGQTMASMDGSIATVAGPTIRDHLHASGATLQMIISSYLLAFAALVVTGARLGDIHGRRRVFVIGLAGFTLASAVCGLASSAVVLIVARIVQGGSAALMVPQVLSFIQLLFEGLARRRAIGLYSLILALGVAIGQIVGGVIVTADLFGASWRPAFLLNVPIGLILLLAAPRLLPDAQRCRDRLDLVGVGLLSAAMTSLVLPLVLGREAGWPWWTWSLLVVGVGGLVAFVGYEMRVPERPLLTLSVLRPVGVRSGLAACFIVMGAYAAFVLSLTLHLQGALRFSPLRAGLSFVPYAGGFAVLSLLWNRPAMPARRILPVIGPLSFASAILVLIVLSQGGWPQLWSIPLLMVAGAGHAAGFSPLLAQVTETVGRSHASAVSAIANTGTLLANVVSIAGLGSVYFGAPDSLSGLTRVVGVLVGLLIVGAGCAWWTLRVAATSAASESLETVFGLFVRRARITHGRRYRHGGRRSSGVRR